MRFYWLSVSLILISFGASYACCQDIGSGQRQLAPGVLNVIPANPDPRDSFSLPMTLPGLNANEYQPNFASKRHTLFGQTRSVVLFRDVWQYEFSFLNLRQAKIEVTRLDGSSSRENVWYLVYRVRNTGATLTYEQVKEDPRFDHIKHDLKRNAPGKDVRARFLPRFVLEGWVKDHGNEYRKVVYRDIPSPTVVRQIQHLEDDNTPLVDTTTISSMEIPRATGPNDGGIWGVAVWTNVNPQIDYVSVFVEGLTNAYRMERKADGSLAFNRRTLQLNFWRPGDSVSQEKDKIDYGIPLVDNPREQIEITKRYDLPGPLIRGYFVSPRANRNVLVAEVDAEVNLSDFTSKLAPVLNDGKMPEAIKQAFADAGVSLPNDLSIATLVNGVRWQFELDADGTRQRYLMQLEPQYWEPEFGTIRFIKSLDHLWIYR